MLDALRFVKGAVARKDFVDELAHFFIENGRVIAYDGLLAMSAPIAVGMRVRPHARTFVNALNACGDDTQVISLNVTPAGRLTVKSGGFRAHVRCIEFPPVATDDNANAEGAGRPRLEPEGADVPLTSELIESIRTLAPLMATDASRPWARGLRIKGDSSYATNNIILAERWHGAKFPHEVILPADCVAELLRVREAPIRAQVSHNSITFHYSGDRWLKSQLVVGEWPDQISSIFDAASNTFTPQISDEFFKALDTLKKFADDRNRVFIFPDRISTHREEAEGAAIDFATDGEGAIFSLDMLMKLNGIATGLSFSTYPRPCPFKGVKLRGVILGQRDDGV